jgi:hypothetical protein
MPFDFGYVDEPVVAHLRDARALIDTPQRWLKNNMADGNGGYCALGALIRIKPEGWYAGYRYIRDLCPSGRIEDFNDNKHTTHADILALFDRAIEARIAALTQS